MHYLVKFIMKINQRYVFEFWLIFGRFSARFWPIFASELSEKGHEPSRAENPSARASSAWAHHYFLPTFEVHLCTEISKRRTIMQATVNDHKIN
jgi:hypothetical protein